jgi:Zn-dependent M28 family amino/carboxypeptidase
MTLNFRINGIPYFIEFTGTLEISALQDTILFNGSDNFKLHSIDWDKPKIHEEMSLLKSIEARMKT